MSFSQTNCVIVLSNELCNSSFKPSSFAFPSRIWYNLNLNYDANCLEILRLNWFLRTTVLGFMALAHDSRTIPRTSTPSTKLLPLQVPLSCHHRSRLILWLTKTDTVLGYLRSQLLTSSCASSITQFPNLSVLCKVMPIDGFHSIFSLGNWRALHHHAACWLINIHVTWPFCPTLSVVKDTMDQSIALMYLRSV